ncbi:MAG TPA: hypothetical protein VFE61_15035 [Candidatus Sulfotelmatobacter sp.]|jgi:hypothetical protein|nr:hypothetical protein [Candidatus Sulfotelmatobacter sp.]
MNFPEVLPRIASALSGAGVAHMLTGSFAGAYYGSLRSTQDIDLVVAATPAQLRIFVESLPTAEYYVDLDSALEAHRRESMFNVIDLRAGWKIDMIIRKSRPFSQEEFARRQPLAVENVPLFVASAEDVIIVKLEWSRLAQSRRQIEDAAGILKLQGNNLDRSYLERWVRELELTMEWNDAQRSASI